MRNVLKSSEVFHYFANKVQPSGRAGNCSFAHPRAYSYAACIGKHFAEGVALASGTWSVTTSGHQSDLRRACSHLTTVHVPSPDDVRESYRQVNLEVAGLLKKASVAKARKDEYLGEALRKIEDFNTFAKWCKSKLHIAAPVTDPDALKAIAVAVKAATKAHNEKLAERKRQDALEIAEKLAEWKAGSSVYLPHNIDMALRIKDDQIETTRGARIPVSEAPVLWRLITRAMKGERDYEVGQPVGAYHLTKICRNGSMIVGCHNIPYSETSGIAQQLGL